MWKKEGGRVVVSYDSTWSPQELEEARKTPPLETWGEVWPWDTLIWNFWLPKPKENSRLLF